VVGLVVEHRVRSSQPINDTFTGQLDLENPGAHTLRGACTFIPYDHRPQEQVV